MPTQIDWSTMSTSLRNDEKQELFLQLLTSPELFEAARGRLDSHEHLDQYEQSLTAVWDSATSMVAAGGHIPLPVESLRTEVSQNLEMSGPLEPDDYVDLFGAAELPKWVRKQYPEAEVYEDSDNLSFFGRLQRVAESELDLARGRELLRRFLYSRHVAAPFRELLSMPQLPDPIALRQEFDSRLQVVDDLTSNQVRSFSRQWAEHGQDLKRFRGRTRIGLRTGMNHLDENTLGLRDLILLAALPGGGKTAYTIEMSLGVCAYHEENDAIVVFVSLEMDSATILNRIKCNLAEIDFTNLTFGSRSVQYTNVRSQDLQGNTAELSDEEDLSIWFDEDDQCKLCAMERRCEESQLNSRFILLDRGDITAGNFSQQVVRAVKDAKVSANASRALVVVDYLQVIPVPPEVERQGDLSADRFRVDTLQQILAAIKTGTLPDCVLAISEARKPSKASESWGSRMSELMGSARLGYAASAVLLYNPMKDDEIRRYYGNIISAERWLTRLDERGICPVEIKLVKGRDGMRRSSWGVEYQYMRNIFTEIDRQRAAQQMENDDNGHRTLPTAEVASEPNGAPKRKKAARKRRKKAARKRTKKAGR